MTVLLERPAELRRRDGGSGWRPALRIARRELLRAKARTAVVLLMVLLPVAAVVALDTLARTADISAAESLPTELGSAQARIEVPDGRGAVLQSPDARQVEGFGSATAPVDEADLRAALPSDSRLLTVRSGGDRGLRTPEGRSLLAVVLGVDLRDAGVRGPFSVLSGRPPAAVDEVAVSPALARAGFADGSVLQLSDGQSLRVTGTVAVPGVHSDTAVLALPEALDRADAPLRWLYVSGAEVEWTDVRALNALGAVVLSRAVLRDPPPDEQVPALPSYDQQARTAVALVGLVVVMAVLEVVLLAGPAFAVGARRSRRALALLAATGGEPRHVRRVVLAQGLLVGSVAAVLGAGLGVALAAVARGPLTAWSDARWGPFEVSVRDVVLLGLLGAGTAVLAALLPALVAERQPVVDSLRGRRTSTAHSPVPTAAGLALLLLGVLLCVVSLAGTAPELVIAFSALPTVVGAVLLAPALLRAQGRLAGRLPLPLRYAVRDADRQRSRTAPAVAAVAATVAAAFALGTASVSDARQQRETHAPTGPPGAAVVTAWSAPDTDWPALETAARRALPGERVVEVRGLLLGVDDGSGVVEEVQLCRPGPATRDACDHVVTAFSASLGGSVLVGAAAVDALAPLLEPGSAATARRALAAGAVVVFGPTPDPVELRRERLSAPDGGGETQVRVVARTTSPAVEVRAREVMPPALAVVGEEQAGRLGGATPVALVVGDALSTAQEQRLRDALSAVDAATSTSVERGPEDADDLVLLLLVLGAGTLVLAGTFAATSLALVEAQPDFAVLGQVGARPRARRTVAGAYAALLALSGALLGVLAGAVPGVTAAIALTRTDADVSNLPGVQVPPDWAYVEVPWLLLVGLLVVLPLLAGALAALTARGTPATAAVRRTA